MTEPYQLLEQEIGRWANVENVVACASGSAALHLSLEALQLPTGSEVIVPDFAMIACARAVTLAGLVPVFVDCGDDLLMDLNLTEDYLGRASKVGALMVVHIYGRRLNMERLRRITARQCPGTPVIEDMAELHGISPHPKTDAVAWSFYRNKVVCGEEGGAVAFRSPTHATLARSLRCLGFTDAHDFTHRPRGHNYRMSNIHAELIRQSLARVETNLALRRQIEAVYNDYCPDEWKMPPRQSPWVYDLRIEGMTRDRQDAVVKALNTNGISARHAFKPMSSQAEYRDCRKVSRGNADRLSREVMYLPVQPGLTTEEQIKLSFDTIRAELA